MPKIISAVIITFWAIMSFLYLKSEVLPTLPALTQPSYEAFLKNKTMTSKSKMGIYYGGQKLGSSVTTTETLSNGYHQISNRTILKRLPLLPVETKVEITAQSFINTRYQLDSFQLKVKSLLFNYEINGKVENNELVVTVFDGRNTQTRRVSNPPNTTLSNGLSPFLNMPNLQVGKEWTISMLNPLSGGLERVRAFVESKDTIEWQDNSYEVYEVVLDYRDFKPRAWITPDGKILKEELVMSGLYFIRE